MVSILHGNIPWIAHYTVSGLRGSHMKVPDVVSADTHARILIFIRTKGRLAPSRDGIPEDEERVYSQPVGDKQKRL